MRCLCVGNLVLMLVGGRVGSLGLCTWGNVDVDVLEGNFGS